MMIGLPFPFIIGGLGYLICVHLYNDETQSCPIMDIFCPKKSTKAVTVSMPEVDLEDDWWKGLVVAVIVIMLILSWAPSPNGLWDTSRKGDSTEPYWISMKKKNGSMPQVQKLIKLKKLNLHLPKPASAVYSS